MLAVLTLQCCCLLQIIVNLLSTFVPKISISPVIFDDGEFHF